VNTGEQDTLDQHTGHQDVGNVPPSPAGEHSDSADDPRAHTRDTSPLAVTKRLQAEGRWAEIEQTRDEMMRVARKQQGLSKTEAQEWVYAELDRLYPPSPSSEVASDEAHAQGSQSSPRDSGQIQGLAAIPEDWPDLPSNASLAAEVGWVQANRLRIVAEHPSGATSVHLDQALSPAPSWAALGWLETSVRSYAKYVDVAAKATSSDDGEAGVMRRERMAIEEVKRLLDEMRRPG